MTLDAILLAQSALLALCAGVLVVLVRAFPHPSPLLRSLLPARKAWPQALVESWVETGAFDRGFLRYFGRDPERAVPPGGDLVAPADGLVQQIVRRDGLTFFVVGLSFWDVHVVRTPVAGRVTDITAAGSCLPRRGPHGEAMLLRDKPAPVQQVVTVASDFGELRVRLVTSYWASRLVVWSAIGSHVAKGERIGRIKLGSTVILELSGAPAMTVAVGDRVVGGETIIAKGPPAP